MAGKVFIGTVTSTKMEKTIVVNCLRRFREERTGKFIGRSKKYKVHCVDPSVVEGDKVTFTECSPISKDKRFRFLKVVQKSVGVDPIAEA